MRTTSINRSLLRVFLFALSTGAIHRSARKRGRSRSLAWPYSALSFMKRHPAGITPVSCASADPSTPNARHRRDRQKISASPLSPITGGGRTARTTRTTERPLWGVIHDIARKRGESGTLKCLCSALSFMKRHPARTTPLIHERQRIPSHKKTRHRRDQRKISASPLSFVQAQICMLLFPSLGSAHMRNEVDCRNSQQDR